VKLISCGMGGGYENLANSETVSRSNINSKQ